MHWTGVKVKLSWTLWQIKAPLKKKKKKTNIVHGFAWLFPSPLANSHAKINLVLVWVRLVFIGLQVWVSVEGVTPPPPQGSWDGLQQESKDPECRISGRKMFLYEFAALTEHEAKTKFSDVFQCGTGYTFKLTSLKSEPCSPDATFMAYSVDRALSMSQQL